MNVILSFSAGKDSILALHKTIAAGHTCVGLLVMYNSDAGRSWFHGVEPTLLGDISQALGIPLILCPTEGNHYHTAMESRLMEAKALGAEACVFGDIDIAEHRAWDEARCRAAELTPLLPLWGMERETCVRETLDLGYRCLIKCVDNTILPERLLRKPLGLHTLKTLGERGADLCGENGEYHTLVVDGPLFRRPVNYVCGKLVRMGHISAVDIRLKEDEMP